MESVDEIMVYFQYNHLPKRLRDVSKPFCELAWQIYETLPAGQQRAIALQKLLEAKDAAVRASLHGPEKIEAEFREIMKLRFSAER